MGLPYMPNYIGVVWGVNVGIYGIHGVFRNLPGVSRHIEALRPARHQRTRDPLGDSWEYSWGLRTKLEQL